MNEKNEKKAALKGTGKALVAVIVAAVAVFAVLVTIRCRNLENELKTAQEAAASASQMHGDAALEEKLDDIYLAEDAEKEDREALARLVTDFISACYRAPASAEYAQAPYLAQYMTDQGVRDYLIAVNPAKWGKADTTIAADVRAAYDEAAEWRDMGVSLSGKKIYTELTRDGADVLLYCDLRPDGAQYNTMSFLLEAKCVKDGDGTWKINELDAFQQVV